MSFSALQLERRFVLHEKLTRPWDFEFYNSNYQALDKRLFIRSYRLHCCEFIIDYSSLITDNLELINDRFISNWKLQIIIRAFIYSVILPLYFWNEFFFSTHFSLLPRDIVILQNNFHSTMDSRCSVRKILSVAIIIGQDFFSFIVLRRNEDTLQSI